MKSELYSFKGLQNTLDDSIKALNEVEKKFNSFCLDRMFEAAERDYLNGDALAYTKLKGFILQMMNHRVDLEK